MPQAEPLTYNTNTNGCWVWTGKMFSNGYGRVGYKLAHRISYEMYRGEISKGLQIDHLCRNRACVNPYHLEPVTIKINVLRGESPHAINARKTHCNKGHALIGDNIYYRKDRPQRGCRICRSDAVTRHKARKRG